LARKIAGQIQPEHGNSSSSFTNNDVGAEISSSSSTGDVQELAILHNYFPFVNYVFFGYCRLGLHLPYQCNAMTIFLVWIVLDLAVVDLDFDCLIGTSRVSQSLQAYSNQYIR
jgi:hypothetical protein